MALSYDEVRWTYRVLLNREVESEETLRYMAQAYDSVADIGTMIIAAEEFQSRLRKIHSHPEPDLQPVNLERRELASPTLALCAIVRDESNRIRNMLSSVVSVIDYAVIVDTGSEDDTREICRDILCTASKPHQIAQIPFSGDFSVARNGALDLVPSDISWILILDADESFSPHDAGKLRALIQLDVDAWDLPRYNWNNPERTSILPGTYPDFQRRLFRNNYTPPIRYKGYIHEYVTGARHVLQAPTNTLRHGGRLGGPHIQHHGFERITKEDFDRKAAFYASLERARNEV
jgi:glycosyltransferase involved in cell wall biosynthesis